MVLADFLTRDDIKDAADREFDPARWGTPMFPYTDAGALEAIQRTMWGLGKFREGGRASSLRRALGMHIAALWVGGWDELHTRATHASTPQEIQELLEAVANRIRSTEATASPASAPSVSSPEPPRPTD